jgi:hydrogenase maturation protein HypF
VAGHNATLTGEEALRATIAHLSAGKTVSLRGLGGYQLLVDATNEAAVIRLRERKGRRAKPLAVMVESVDAARRLAHLSRMRRRPSCWCGPAPQTVSRRRSIRI